jgi:hypothetical protein
MSRVGAEAEGGKRNGDVRRIESSRSLDAGTCLQAYHRLHDFFLLKRKSIIRAPTITLASASG